MNGIGVEKKEETERVEDHKEMDRKREKAEGRKEPDTKFRKAKKAEDMTKQELLKKLRDTEEEAQKNYDLYMRTYAEMENIKKRGIKERQELSKYANESLIKEILPVIDNLQKAISHAQNDKNPSGLVEGIELTLDSLLKTLEKAGLKEVEAEGKPFDPNFHQAISKQRDDKVAPGHVIMELQKGYLLNGRLIRPSMVVISEENDSKREDTV
ncbi:MAG: nucleotide exchange factor GrpE [Deltaproteobacteria bacterium]|nr:MAG: nucleotide exchange factor GrpE [Deltaproteobacteria bacterium]